MLLQGHCTPSNYPVDPCIPATGTSDKFEWLWVPEGSELECLTPLWDKRLSSAYVYDYVPTIQRSPRARPSYSDEHVPRRWSLWCVTNSTASRQISSEEYYPTIDWCDSSLIRNTCYTPSNCCCYSSVSRMGNVIRPDWRTCTLNTIVALPGTKSLRTTAFHGAWQPN